MSRIPTCLSVALLTVLAPYLRAEEPPPRAPGHVDVQAFGARGDGRTDDTGAIRAAIAEQNRDRGTGRATVGYASVRTLFFPAGRYVISDTLALGPYAVVRGDQAVIEQKDPTRDIFTAPGYRNAFIALRFVGGRRAIAMRTNNIDTCTPKVRRCHFHHTAGPAIEMADPSGSTLLSVTDCLFVQCEQVLVNRYDHAVLRDCWITTSRSMAGKAVIENHGLLACENILGVPLVNGRDQRWIDPLTRGTPSTRSRCSARWFSMTALSLMS